MRFSAIGRIVFALTVAVGTASIAYAQSISDCQALLVALRVKAQSVPLTGQNADRERAGLVNKLNEAAIKLNQAKFCDSLVKLNDFEVKLQQLASAGKITFEDAEVLSRDAATASQCVQNVATSAGVACGG